MGNAAQTPLCRLNICLSNRKFRQQRTLSRRYFDRGDFDSNPCSPEAKKFSRLLSSAQRVSALANVGAPQVYMIYGSGKGEDCQFAEPNGNGQGRIYYSEMLANRFGDHVLDGITAHEIAHSKGIRGQKKADEFSARLLGSAKGLLDYFEFKRKEYLSSPSRGFIQRCILAVETKSPYILPKFPGARAIAALVFAFARPHPSLAKRVDALREIEAELEKQKN